MELLLTKAKVIVLLIFHSKNLLSIRNARIYHLCIKRNNIYQFGKTPPILSTFMDKLMKIFSREKVFYQISLTKIVILRHQILPTVI